MKYIETERMQPWVSRAILLALVTGQRVGDIAEMKFSDIWDDVLHIVQEKTGSKVAILLSLRCDANGMSLREVVTLCRDSILSPWILHQRHSQGNCKPAEKLKMMIGVRNRRSWQHKTAGFCRSTFYPAHFPSLTHKPNPSPSLPQAWSQPKKA